MELFAQMTVLDLVIWTIVKEYALKRCVGVNPNFIEFINIISEIIWYLLLLFHHRVAHSNSLLKYIFNDIIFHHCRLEGYTKKTTVVAPLERAGDNLVIDVLGLEHKSLTDFVPRYLYPN